MNKSIWIPMCFAAAYGMGVMHAGGKQELRIKEPRTQADFTRLIDSMKRDLDKMDGIVEKEFDAHADLLNAMKKVEREKRMSFGVPISRLQEAMQAENRKYESVSNVLKTRHDTAKNSIGNIR